MYKIFEAFLVSILVLIACQQNGSEVFDASSQSVNYQSCLPPCWESLVPGVSAEDDVVRVLKELKTQHRLNSYAQINVGNYLAHLPSGVEIQIGLQNNQVYWITGRLYDATYPVAEVIDQFGNPESYLADSVSSEEVGCSEWNSVEAYPVPRGPAGFLVYASQGLTFRVRKSERWPGLICPDVLVTEFDYYEPRPLDSIFEEDGRPATSGLPYGPENMIPWHGYGDGY